MLNNTEFPNKKNVLASFMKGFIEVAFGQARDMHMAAINQSTVEQVMEMYAMKTASYTFCLPLKLAGLITGISSEQLQKLDEIGKILGVMFQAKDDVLNIFGQELTTGKSVGSDIVENKQTLIKSIIIELASSDKSAQKLLGYFGKPLTPTKYSNFCKLASKLEIENRANLILLDQHLQFNKKIKEIHLPTAATELLIGVEQFIRDREK